ncbi:MAG: hypothetical protein ACTH58_10640 [Marinomonas foliarum]|jgi:hypothetical protein|uniref:Uncharacterized protein n=1 Tax=Marinomonas foliarum TaxID=491950 RepID=A0A368ZK76_9GAMM|nr:hypothetical protein [Marinomonas foliarum]QRV23955.1 hypothetical protein JSY38_18395 [Marinomonas foliarum]RCW94345.1 hypothetical protein DFP77_14817 [Marinomonas foliarum]
MSIHKSETLPDVTYWLALEIAKVDPVVDLDAMYKGSLELDFLYQLLTCKAQQYWWQEYGIQLSPVIVNNAFFRAIAMLHNRNIEFTRSRNREETVWVRELLNR